MANITLFNKSYWIRRFAEQEIVNGYITNGFSDIKVSLHVHPLGSEQIQALPEGERGIKRLEGHGTDILHTANSAPNNKADLLYYKGEWYECVSCEYWEHTVLAHWNYQFAALPKNGQGSGTSDTSNPPDEQVL